MNKSNSEVSLYVDTLLVEALLSDPQIIKTAQSSMASGLVEAVKSYFGSHIDPNDKAGSLLNMLAPGAIAVVFAAIGGPMKWLGTLIGLAMNVFHIDVKGILSSIYDKIKGVIGSGELMSSSQVDGIVSGAVSSLSKPATEEDLKNIPEGAMPKVSSNRDIRFIKIAMIIYHNEIEKVAKPGDRGMLNGMKSGIENLFSKFTDKKMITESLLGRVLGWFFKVAIASAGLMVAGDVINKFLGRSNALDSSLKDGKETKEQVSVPLVETSTSTQTKFKVNPSYRMKMYNTSGDGWVEAYQNTSPGIESMLLDFTKEVYVGLDGLESIIKNTAGFKVILDKILHYNHAGHGNSIIYIPRMFQSKKSIVDFFIDDVAEKVK